MLLDAVESKIASERGREVLREFLRTLMRDRHLRFLGEELALAANIVQGKYALFNGKFGSVCINTIGLESNWLDSDPLNCNVHIHIFCNSYEENF